MPKVYGNVCTTTEKPIYNKQTEKSNNKNKEETVFVGSGGFVGKLETYLRN